MGGWLSPISNPQAWDVVQIGQQTSPGICKIGDFKAKKEWDVKKGKGVLGATITFVGRPPAQGSITFKLWSDAHFAAWETFQSAFQYDPTRKAVQAIDIYHPALAAIDINSVVCEGIGAPNHVGEGMYEVVVDLLEYFPPPKSSAIGTPSGSVANKTVNGDSTATNDPVADAQQKEIAALLQKASQP